MHLSSILLVLERRRPYGPIIRKVTRWSSTYETLKRYTQLKPHIDQKDVDFLPLLLSPTQDNCIQKPLDHLKDFESVCKKMQNEKTSILECRILFDGLLRQYSQKYPGIVKYLSNSESHGFCSEFESAVLKQMQNRE